MGRIFAVTDEIRALAQDAISDLIDGLGKACVLHYTPTWAAAPSGSVETVGGKPPNRWVTGGAARLSDVGNPQTGGENLVATETTETVTMLVAWQVRNFWLKPEAGVMIPAGTIQTKGFIADAPKVMKASYMILSPANTPGLRWKFERDSEPADVSNIAQDAFFVCNWKRVI